MILGLNHYLGLAAIIFCIGLYGVLVKRNAIIILMCIEIMLNGVNIALVAFSRFVTPAAMTGQVFTMFIIVVAAMEAAVGVGIIMAVFRHHGSINTTDINLLKW
ncbi:MAG: NADH-ubiquinone oxidoreductase chain [Chloroflexi bacterium]|jgi:NADH:ubiquinone oxidoreductase subunit K|nr:NADH-ubiquinone oxidoreductase chain [Chloroflexota bacterium]